MLRNIHNKLGKTVAYLKERGFFVSKVVIKAINLFFHTRKIKQFG